MSRNARPGSDDFRFPCRFPAKPSIITECHMQVYVITGVFGIGKPRKKIFPRFSLCGRERERRSCPPQQTPRRCCRRLGSQGPITPRIVAVQPAPLRRRGILSAQILHLRNRPAWCAFIGEPTLAALRDYVAASPSGYGWGVSDADLMGKDQADREGAMPRAKSMISAGPMPLARIARIVNARSRLERRRPATSVTSSW